MNEQPTMMLQHALDYAARGWAVFPLHGKQPAIPKSKGGNGVKDATTDPETIKRWWARFPNANIGLATGHPSGVWVLDIDTKPAKNGVSGFAGCQAMIDEHDSHDFYQYGVRTGSGGLHAFLKMPPQPADVRNRQRLKTSDGTPTGVDVRGTGGYVILPPSIHPNGTQYTWDCAGTEPPEAPQWLLDWAAPPPEEKRAPAAVIPLAPEGDRKRKYGNMVLETARNRILDTPPGQDRHGTILRESRRVAGYVASGCIDEDTARAVLIDAGMAAGKGRREVERTVNDGIRDGLLAPIDPTAKPEWGSRLASRAASAPQGPQQPHSPAVDTGPTIEPPDGRFGLPTPPRHGGDLPDISEDRPGCKLWRGDEVELSEILREHWLGDHIVHTTGALYRYEPERHGWHKLTDEQLVTWVSRLAGASIYAGLDKHGEVKRTPLKLSMSKARGAVQLACSAVHHPEDMGDFWQPETGQEQGVAQFRNTAVVVRQIAPGKLELHTEPSHPDHRVRAVRVLPCDWMGVQPMEQLHELCPAFSKVTWDWWGHHGKDECDARTAAVLQFLGASVLGMAPLMAQAMFLYGKGGSGKSTLLTLMTRWCSRHSVSSVSPHEMGTNRFAPARLDGAMLNVFDDLPRNPITDIARWKSSITGGRMDVERKGQDGYGIYPSAGHIYAGNKLPAAKGATSGFWRRWLLVEFDRVFAKTERKPVVHKLLEEMPAVIACAISAFLETGGLGGKGYTEPGCHHDLMGEWSRISDSVAAFAEDHMRKVQTKTRKAWPKRSEVYKAYSEWCTSVGRRPVGAEEFGNRCKDMGVQVAKSGSWRVDHEVYGLEKPEQSAIPWRARGRG